MPKSEYARAMDQLQAVLRPFMKEYGFRVRGRTFNRATRDQLTQVVNLQMGSFDPPGTTYTQGLRENLYGWFTVNLGVYVPEVAKYHGGGEATGFVQDYHCCIRARLGTLGPERQDLWWRISTDEPLVTEFRDRLTRDGLPFLAKFETRESILQEWESDRSTSGASSPRRIVLAIILATESKQDEARKLLAAQIRETANRRHREYICSLATKLGIATLDD